MSAPEQFEYRAEMKQLLHLIVHSLYTHPEIFLRELISNASDALNKARFMQVTNLPVHEPDAELRIAIELDEKRNTFSIEDTGIGMSRDELIDRIGTVAASGTLDFIDAMRAEKSSLDGDLIGKFGVGFYSVFMVADEVTIETRHADPDSKGYRWKSSGEGSYTIEEIERVHRGTRIYFTLKQEAKEFAQAWRVKDIIRKYSNFVDFPIAVSGERVNSLTALWRRSKDSVTQEELGEFYKFITGDPQSPLGHLHLNLEGKVSFRALLFIPAAAPFRLHDLREQRSLHLYSNRVLITDDCKDLLPEYLLFLKGVVDTEDLPLNVSREAAQSSPVMAKIREALTGRTLSMLEEWAAKDGEKYDKFFSAFGMLFKAGVATDFAHRDRIIELLRFPSTKCEDGKTVSLKEYSARMKPESASVYYAAGERAETIALDPKLEYFRKNDIEVLLFADPMDAFIAPMIGDYAGKKLVSIAQADIDIPAPEETKEEIPRESAGKLLALFRETLGDRIEDVRESKRLVDSAATLVAAAGAMDAHVERMMKALDRDFEASKRILEVNLAHPLLRNMSGLAESGADEELLRDCVLQLYEGALLQDHALETPVEFVRRMTAFMERATRGRE